jgi:hypothetical protein
VSIRKIKDKFVERVQRRSLLKLAVYYIHTDKRNVCCQRRSWGDQFLDKIWWNRFYKPKIQLVQKERTNRERYLEACERVLDAGNVNVPKRVLQAGSDSVIPCRSLWRHAQDWSVSDRCDEIKRVTKCCWLLRAADDDPYVGSFSVCHAMSCHVWSMAQRRTYLSHIHHKTLDDTLIKFISCLGTPRA